MAAIRSKNTRPELQLRTALRRRGLTGYRCHAKELPGCPDIVFTRLRVAIFVDGAYWHGHPRFVREKASTYWRTKIERNRARDREHEGLLRSMGWVVLRFWDFEVLADVDRCVDTADEALKRAFKAPIPGMSTHRQGPNLQ